jgi:hypothetical protein
MSRLAALVLVVCALGAAHDAGAITLPDPAAGARADLREFQARQSHAIACERAALAALDAEDVAAYDAVAERCGG